MPIQKDKLRATTDSVGVKIFRGDGTIETPTVEKSEEYKTSTGSPIEAKLLQSKKLQGKNLLEWQSMVWQMLMGAVGKQFLGIKSQSEMKGFFRVRLEIQQGDPICQRCRCFNGENMLCDAETSKDTLICENFVPNADAFQQIWQWIIQGRLLPWDLTDKKIEVAPQ
ncbi:hypothetical protein KKG63_03630 [Patescibacteria group bacterium]|nr:hypothetical protein [Patescibacteria group bacterium]MBU1999480.1 hypothetical protein [Candidatus Omnitrophota bacterium]